MASRATECLDFPRRKENSVRVMQGVRFGNVRTGHDALVGCGDGAEVCCFGTFGVGFSSPPRPHRSLYTTQDSELTTSHSLPDSSHLSQILRLSGNRIEEKKTESGCLRRRGSKMNHVRATRSIWRINSAARCGGQVSRRMYAGEGPSIPPQPTPPKTPASPPSPNSASKPTSRTVRRAFYHSAQSEAETVIEATY